MEGDLVDLELADLPRARRTYGLFDTLALSVHYDFTSDEFERAMAPDARDGGDEALRTIYHETTHLYHLVATPYGYYYSMLKAFQTQQIVGMILLLRDDYGVRLRYPLRRLIDGLGEDARYAPVRAALLRWYIAELLVLVFEGKTDLSLNLRERHQVLSTRSLDSLLAEMDVHLAGMFAGLGFDVTPEQRTGFGGPASVPADKIAMGLKATGELDVGHVLESAATVAELWVDDPNADPAALVEGRTGADRYYVLLRYAIDRLQPRSVREFTWTYAALVELALFAPLLPQQRAFRDEGTSVMDFHPLARLFAGLRAAGELRPVEEGSDYRRFQVEVCDELGWPAPSRLCADAVDHPLPDPIDPKTQLFYWSLQFRHDVVPYAFADLGVYRSRQDNLTRWFRAHFRHPIVEFTDGHWIATGSSPWFYVVQHVVHEYLRRVLLGSDLAVELPYRASGDELRSFAESAADTLAEIGVGRPRLDLRPGTAHVGGSVS